MIGHDRKNEIVVDEESMSAHHARLTVASESEIYIEDTESANGVFVNGERVEGMVQITPQCTVHLGQNILEFQRGGLPASVFDYMPERFLKGGRYALGEAVVQGRTSTIYQAYDTSLNREVALKAMLPESQASLEHVLGFIREAQISSQLQHPGIPPVYELSVDEQNRLFYTTRFVEGETLASALDELHAGEKDAAAGFSLAALIVIFQKICETVAYAHAHGVVHTALRSDHLMIGSYGEVFVTTWGMAKILEPEISEEGVPSFQPVHAPGALAQAPLSRYSAPEQATDSYDQVGVRTDIYALGAILYRIIFLQSSLNTDDPEVLLSQILLGQHTAPATLAKPPLPHWPGGKMPEFLAEVAMKALSQNPDDRPASVTELMAQIRHWQDGVATSGDKGGLFKSFLGKH
jgi:serine/threonine protein kinase